MTSPVSGGHRANGQTILVPPLDGLRDVATAGHTCTEGRAALVAICNEQIEEYGEDFNTERDEEVITEEVITKEFSMGPRPTTAHENGYISPPANASGRRYTGGDGCGPSTSFGTNVDALDRYRTLLHDAPPYGSPAMTRR